MSIGALSGAVNNAGGGRSVRKGREVKKLRSGQEVAAARHLSHLPSKAPAECFMGGNGDVTSIIHVRPYEKPLTISKIPPDGLVPRTFLLVPFRSCLMKWEMD